MKSFMSSSCHLLLCPGVVQTLVAKSMDMCNRMASGGSRVVCCLAVDRTRAPMTVSWGQHDSRGPIGLAQLG